MITNNKIAIYQILFITLIVISIIGISYAAFILRIVGSEKGTTLSSGSGTVEINYDGGPAINAPNIYPREEEFLTKTFTLNGKNTYNTKMEYHIILKMNTNTFRDGALAYTLTSVNNNNNGQTVQQIEYLNGIKTGEREVFLGNGFFEGISDDTHTYTLKMYLPLIENFDHTVDQNKEFSAKIEVREGEVYPGYNPEKGVNHPVLFTGMTPVKWNGTTEINTTSDDPDWYDYDEKRWANAKSADGSYWVWIPRYAYKIESCYHTSGEDCKTLTGKQSGDIDVKFLKGTTNITEDNTPIESTGYEAHVKDTSMHHFLHPAFQFNGEELGFWVAKFEASNSNNLPKFVPNATSWRAINIATAFNMSVNIKTEKDNFGWDKENLDSHLITNLEWGAIAYLSKSKYGAYEEEVWHNAYTSYKTGCSGTSAKAKAENICIEYDTVNGQKASTTHNIYGIYDMSGGSWERVMANYNYLVGDSGFVVEELYGIQTKYLTSYFTLEIDLLNGVGMAYDSTIYGDAVYETSNNAFRYNGSSWSGNSVGTWYNNYSWLPYVTQPWFNRGGSSLYSGAGIFDFDHSGYSTNQTSFRPVLTPLS